MAVRCRDAETAFHREAYNLKGIGVNKVIYKNVG